MLKDLPTVDEETMKLLVDRVTKSVTGKLLSNEDGKMMANVRALLLSIFFAVGLTDTCDDLSDI